jgi:hypothetical protein
LPPNDKQDDVSSPAQVDLQRDESHKDAALLWICEKIGSARSHDCGHSICSNRPADHHEGIRISPPSNARWRLGQHRSAIGPASRVRQTGSRCAARRCRSGMHPQGNFRCKRWITGFHLHQLRRWHAAPSCVDPVQPRLMMQSVDAFEQRRLSPVRRRASRPADAGHRQRCGHHPGAR